MLILYVEDNDDHAELFFRSLEENCTSLDHIIRLKNGQEALDYLYARGDYAEGDFPRPKVLFLDINLPKVSGLEVLAKVKDDPALRNIPVVMLTSSLLPSDMAKAYHHHVNSYVEKPLDFNKFSELLKNVGRYWKDWNQVSYCRD